MEQAVEVVVKRNIRVGLGYTIVPSEAFSGIPKGNVKVLGIYEYGKMDEATRDIAMSIWDVGEPEAVQEWQAGLWIMYHYTDRKSDLELAPINVFAHHVVPRY